MGESSTLQPTRITVHQQEGLHANTTFNYIKTVIMIRNSQKHFCTIFTIKIMLCNCHRDLMTQAVGDHSDTCTWEWQDHPPFRWQLITDGNTMSVCVLPGFFRGKGDTFNTALVTRTTVHRQINKEGIN